MSHILKKLGRDLSANAPTILTVTGMMGVGLTAFLTARASIEAIDVIREVEGDDPPEDPVERHMARLKLTWHIYLPATASGVFTMACIFSAHRVSIKRQAALLGLYSVTDTAFREYREKVRETVGQNKEQAVRDEVAKDRIDRTPVESSQIYVTGSDQQLCYDSFSGRYFKSDIEKIRKSQNDINQTIINNMYASQNDFYRLLGLATTSHGEEVGWTTDNLMDISFSTHLTEDGRPCLSLDYNIGPSPNYYKLY